MRMENAYPHKPEVEISMLWDGKGRIVTISIHNEAEKSMENYHIKESSFRRFVKGSVAA